MSISRLVIYSVFLNAITIYSPLMGATITWNGGGGANTWSTDANWNPSGDPALNSDLSMSGTLRLTNNIDNGAGITLQYNSITFSSGAGGSFLIGGGTVTNGAGGITVNTKNFSQTMTNITTVLSASQTWTVESNSFRTDAAIKLGANGLLATGVSNITINGNLTGTGEITHGGLGRLVLSGDNSGFSGVITNNAGIIETQSPTGLGIGNIIINGGVINYTTANQNYGQTFIFNTASTQDVASGTVVTMGHGLNTVTGSGLIVKQGVGELIITNHSTQDASGGWRIDAGTVTMDIQGGIGTGTITMNGGTLRQYVSSFALDNAFHVTADSTIAVTNGSDLTLNSTDISATSGTKLTLHEVSGLNHSGSLVFAGSNFTYAGNIFLQEPGLQLAFSGSAPDSADPNGIPATNTISGIISGAGGSSYSQAAVQVRTNVAVIFSGVNTYTGVTRIARGTLIAQSDAALGTTDGGTMVTNDGTLAFQGNINYATAESVMLASTGGVRGVALVNISGTNYFAGMISNTANTSIGTWGGTLELSGNILTLGNQLIVTNGSNTYLTNSGIISGTGNMVHNGSGTLILKGANTFSGGLTNNAGTIESQVQGSLGSGTIVVGGGTLLFSTVNQTNSQSIVLSAASTFNVASGITNTVTGVISGTGGFTKTGTGDLTFSGNNTFSGPITNTAGTLELNSATGLGVTTSVILNGGTLLFKGSLTNTSANVVLNGGVIQEVDTNVSLGALTISANSTVQLNGGGAIGRFTFTSGTNSVGSGAKLTIYGWSWNSALSGGSDDLIFFTNTSFETARFLDNVTFFGTGGGARVLSSGELVPITPEPSTMLFGCFFLCVLGIRTIRDRFK